MLIQPRLGTARQTPAQFAQGLDDIRPVSSAPDRPAISARAAGTFSGSASTRTATRPVLSSPTTVSLRPPPTPPDVGFLSGLGGIVGGIAGFATGGIGGAISGFHAGESAFGGGSQGGAPALPVLAGPVGGVVGSGGINMPFHVNGPGGIPLPGFGTGQSMVVRPHGHMTKGTKKNPSHWSNRSRPRMNPMNVRAGRRAITRIRAAEKLFHRFLSVSHPGHAGHVKPKRIARR